MVICMLVLVHFVYISNELVVAYCHECLRIVKVFVFLYEYFVLGIFAWMHQCWRLDAGDFVILAYDVSLTLTCIIECLSLG